MGKQHIIELNGQRYDARTGEPIATPKPTAKPKNVAAKKPVKTGVSMDGFARPSRGVKQHITPRTPAKSQTLMRKAVKKPAPKATTQKIENPLRPHIIPSASATKKRHAGGVPRSNMVSRFGAPIRTAPTKSQVTSSTQPKPAARQQTTAATKQEHPAIAKALASATSHEQTKLKKPRLNARLAKKLRISPKLVSSGAFALAFLFIGGFFTYQNIPGITMKVAATRSGVQGNLPGYRPSGFRLDGGIAYKKGQITINYKSTTDDRNYKLTQDNSAWDSQSLLDNYIATTRNTYQTVQDKGKTIYIYDESNATWVDGGIWYRIEGDSSLNSHQLLRIAASL